MRKQYQVVLVPSDEGYAASVPELPGCHSQGTDTADALRNIKDAVYEYLEVADENNRE